MFEIEATFDIRGRAYVFARAINLPADFVVSERSRLGGCAVERWLDMPRALDASVKQRTDLFAFCLKEIADRGRLKIGDLVALE